MTLMTVIDDQKRIHRRYDFDSPIEYRLIQDIGNKIFESRTADISRGGFCIYLYNQLPVGQDIEITKNILPFLCRKARVRWTAEVETGLYRTGMNFIE